MKRIALLVMLLCIDLSAGADHLPATLMAMGSPEDTLAGINLRSATWDHVLKKYGSPAQTIKAPNNPGWRGYLWQSAATRLEVQVSHGKTRPYVDTITVVRLGSASTMDQLAAAGVTGRGLKLGDSLDDLKKIYGDRFQLTGQDPVPVQTKPFRMTPGSRIAVVQWMKLDFTLTAGLDQSGRIVALQLRLPSCYPGGCK
jgi:hypothetical protein